jgi:hypothetical protein
VDNVTKDLTAAEGEKLMDAVNGHLRPLVFCLGLVKTGTSSLLQALEIMGWPGCDDISLMQASWEKLRAEEIEKPFEDLTGKYRAFSQNPVALCYPSLLAHYPDAKFILTERDPNEAIVSMLIHVAWNRMHPEPRPPHMQWLDLNTEEDEELYTGWSGKVTNHFVKAGKGNQLLIMDITKGDGWDALCPFLDVPVPAECFPHYNHSKGRLADLLSGRFEYRGKED